MAARKPHKKIDTAALLAGIDIVKVIDARVPLKKEGKEYTACCPFHIEDSPSFKVNPAKQFYHCFGCGANGDAIRFLQEYDGLEFLEACKALGADVDVDLPEGAPQPVQRQPAREKKPEIAWKHVMPVPDDAPEPPRAHTFRGLPEMSWTYRDGSGRVLGYVYRFIKSEGGKETIPLCYVDHPETGQREWRWLSFPEPRPLYGLDRLAAKPDGWVLLVEGEKCADAGAELLPNAAVMAWPGGCKAVGKIDLAPLKGCNVILWPDCDAKRVPLTRGEKEALGGDEAAIAAAQSAKPLLPESEQPGIIAMERIAHELLRLGEGTRARIVMIPPPGAKPDGWDIFDAIHDDGMDKASLLDFCTHLRSPVSLDAPADTSAPDQPAPKKKRKQLHTPNPATAEESGEWFDRLIRKRGDLLSCLSNVYDMLANASEWQGVLGFDESMQRTVKRKPPPYKGGEAGDWEDQDDARAAMWLSRKYYFSPGSKLVSEAVDIFSREHSFHPIREWLEGLAWDGTNRLDDWMADHLGVERSEYTSRISRWYLIGMVSRAMSPGGKFDYCLVLEGEQGLKKSSVLRAIGGEWYGDTDLDLHSKDSMDALRGKWLYEIAEMGALARTEAAKQKSFISRQVDEFRPAFGTRPIKCPRQVVFAGTVNDWEWNKDPTGGRRFWPVRITNEIDPVSFAPMREQLFAEAFLAWKAGERFWPTFEEQKTLFDPIQVASAVQESFIDPLAIWLELQDREFSLAGCANDALKIEPGKLTRDIQTRIGNALRTLGCTRVEKRTMAVRYWYKPPQRLKAGIPIQPAQQTGEDEDVPF